MKDKLEYIIVMALFGCLGPVIRKIGLPSAVTTCLRAWISSAVLVFYMAVTGKKADWKKIRENAFPLLMSGLLMAVDWIGLFESYNHTTIATATVCYYMAPVFTVIGASVFLKEKLTKVKIICTLTAFSGMILVSGIISGEGIKASELIGIAFALSGAVGYAGIVIVNKKHGTLDTMVRTVIQLIIAGAVSTVYVLFRYRISELSVNTESIIYLIILGVFMTAIPYIIYFRTIVAIPSETVAIFAYMDPIAAVLISVFAMGEKMTAFGIAGTLFIIGSAVWAEFNQTKQ